MSEEIVLPKEKIAPVIRNPKNLIIFSPPKTGKTSILAELPKSIIFDFEKGSDYVTAVKIGIDSIKKLKAVGGAIRKEINDTGEFPYDYIGLDTITSLIPIAIEYAELIYSKLPMGKHWFEGKGEDPSGKETYGNILNLPKGAGYTYYWEAYEKIIDFVQGLAPNIIQLAHVKNSEIGKDDNKFASADIALQGKLKLIATSKSDAIGYLYRKGNKNMLSFKTSDEVACGARPSHLSNQEFVLSEKIEGKLVTYWDRVFVNN